MVQNLDQIKSSQAYAKTSPYSLVFGYHAEAARPSIERQQDRNWRHRTRYACMAPRKRRSSVISYDIFMVWERLRSTTRTNTTRALKRRTLKMKLNRRRVGQDKRRVSRLARCPADMNSGHVHESKSPRSRSELLTAGFVVSGSTPSPRLTHRVT